MKSARRALLVAGMIAGFGCSGGDVSREHTGRISSALTQGALRIQYHHGEDGSAVNNEVKPHFRIHNDGSDSVALSELRIRYWYTREGTASELSNCWWAQVGCANITRSNLAMATPVEGADHYFEVGFTSGAGQLLPGADSGEMKLAFHKSDWSNYDENDDHSYVPGQASWADAPNVTLYHNGVLVWGTEPGAGGPDCTDGVQNGDETDVDCGGSCPPCPNGATCSSDSDCQSGNCEGGTCSAAGTEEQLATAANFSGDSGGWISVAKAHDGITCTAATHCPCSGWIEYDFGAVYTLTRARINEDNSGWGHVDAWKLQYY